MDALLKRPRNTILVLLLMAGAALAAPADSHAAVAQALIEQKGADDLAARCDQLDPQDEIDPDKITGFILALNEPLFEKYDLNCNGEFDADELAKYHDDAKGKAEKALRKAEASVKERTQDRVAQYAGKPLSEVDAFRIVPDPGLKSAAVKASFSDMRKPSSDGTNVSFELTAEQQPWRNFRGVLPISIGLDWSLGAKRDSETSSTSKTREEEVTLTPFSIKTTDPDERLTLKLSLGAAYVWSQETILATGVTTREALPTFAYATELSYALGPKKCWSVGLKYEYKSRHAFSDKVATTMKPMLGFKFVCEE